MRLAHHLISRADVVVENFRVGVTERMGIDVETALRLNPELIYLSLSSQGYQGPESKYSSSGSTLDLLSGLAAVTGYRDGTPMWSSAAVNYPDQLVSLLGAGLVVHCLVTAKRGRHLDVSQRDAVAWTLADQLAECAWIGQTPTAAGNRRPWATPHDTYRSSGDSGWLAIACSQHEHRRALAAVVPGLPSAENEQWWWDNQDDVDTLLANWTSLRSRDESVAILQKAGVPAVPVSTAVDRAHDSRYRQRRVALSGPRHVKGFPMVLHYYSPPPPAPAPELGKNVTDWDENTADAFLGGALRGNVR